MSLLLPGLFQGVRAVFDEGADEAFSAGEAVEDGASADARGGVPDGVDVVFESIGGKKAGADW
jgi:hypothetical protein